MTTQAWEIQFDKKVKELETGDYENETTYEFGFRYMDIDEEHIYAATDWGNVKKFIRSLLHAQALSYKKRIDEVIGKDEFMTSDNSYPHYGNFDNNIRNKLRKEQRTRLAHLIQEMEKGEI
jgi:hypothetical protein